MRTKLKTNEEIILTAKKHGIVLLGPIVLFVLFTLVFLPIAVTNSTGFLILPIFFLLLLIYKIYDRKYNIWVITNFRIIDEYGVFSKNSKESSYNNIHNVTYNQPLIGRWFGFGHVRVQTAAESGSSIISTVKNPVLIKDTIVEQVDLYKQKEQKEQAEQYSAANKNNQSTKDTDVSEELKKLHELKKEGAITEEEFNQQKQKILNR